MRLPSEEFLLPVHKFNHAVGPLFAEFRHRFPLSQHTENSLSHSLGLFLTLAYDKSMGQLEALRPVPLSREQWSVAPPEVKAEHMLWQRNWKYLRGRMAHYCALIAHGPRDGDDAL